MSNKAEQAIEIAEKITDLYETNRLLEYEPYEYQKRFHDAKDMKGRLVNNDLPVISCFPCFFNFLFCLLMDL